MKASDLFEAQDLARIKDQILITLLKRLAVNGEVKVPVHELDDTGQDLVDMSIDQKERVFTFTLKKKF